MVTNQNPVQASTELLPVRLQKHPLEVPLHLRAPQETAPWPFRLLAK